MKTWRPWLSQHDTPPLFRTKPGPLVEAACPELTPAQRGQIVRAFRDDLGKRYGEEMGRFYGETWTRALVEEIERCAFALVRQWAREHGILKQEATTDAT